MASPSPSTTRSPCRRLVLLALLAVLTVQGCGFKGDLYLPEEGDQAKPGKSQKAAPQQ